MKTTEIFKQTIKDHLDQKADQDPLFAKSYAKEGKNIDDCIKYILNTVKASEAVGYADEEVYSMAIHYYDEDDIDVGKDIDMRVIVNHKVQLTDEELKKAKKKAMKQAQDEAYKAMMKKSAPKKKPETTTTTQATLF